MAPGAVAPTKHTNLLGGREFPPKAWYKQSGLRKLYLLLGAVIMVSATNGLDGSMLDGMQKMPNWLSRPSTRRPPWRFHRSRRRQLSVGASASWWRELFLPDFFFLPSEPLRLAILVCSSYS